MKYLKTYEYFDIDDGIDDVSEIEDKYWLVKFDDDLGEARLKKIGLGKFQSGYFTRLITKKYNKNGNKVKEILIGYNDDLDWIFNTRNNEYEFIKAGMEYMGEIELTEKEIEDFKFKKEADKYNI
jgi:hypothetical protein